MHSCVLAKLCAGQIKLKIEAICVHVVHLQKGTLAFQQIELLLHLACENCQAVASLNFVVFQLILRCFDKLRIIAIVLPAALV